MLGGRPGDGSKGRGDSDGSKGRGDSDGSKGRGDSDGSEDRGDSDGSEDRGDSDGSEDRGGESPGGFGLADTLLLKATAGLVAATMMPDAARSLAAGLVYRTTLETFSGETVPVWLRYRRKRHPPGALVCETCAGTVVHDGESTPTLTGGRACRCGEIASGFQGSTHADTNICAWE
jgi:hypothetical protein